MKREKSVQIPESLFFDLVKYFFIDSDPAREESIKKSLQAKVDAIIKHNTYSRYKTSPTPEQQEKARREYLELAEIPEHFRW